MPRADAQRRAAGRRPAVDAGGPSSPRDGDAELIDLLRAEEQLSVAALAGRLGVTATAVRQRLDRLMESGAVDRITVSPAGSAQGPARRPRGRPSHAYRLTDKGRRTGGDNFRDLALVLWREIRGIREPAVRQGLMARVGASMAGLYRDSVAGKSRVDRMETVADMLRQRRIACGVEPSSPDAGGLPVLTSYACPYPELAEHDRGICAAERLMLQELLESSVELSACRLDGDSCCRFTVGIAAEPSRAAAAGLATNPSEASNA